MTHVIINTDDASQLRRIKERVLGRDSRPDRHRRATPELEPETALIELFRVDEVKDDTLECRRIDPKYGTLGVHVFEIARPYTLQRTPFDGQTIAYPGNESISYAYTSSRQRTAVRGVDTEIQVITPDYFVGDQVLAILVTTDLRDSEGTLITWMDLNTAARAWALEPEETLP